MRIVAMISHYDEDVSRLIKCIGYVADLGATHVVMVDGAYALYPDGRRTTGAYVSSFASEEAEVRGLGFLAYTPRDVFAGNEAEKRQVMLDLALSITTDDDFLLPWDADFALYKGQDLTQMLREHPGRWADVALTDSPTDAGWYWVRLLLRSVRGMHFKKDHYTYHYPDGDHTVVGPRGADLARGLKLPVWVRHSPDRPDQPGRRDKQKEYYKIRDSTGIER
jgi:hypothetical protein